MLGFLVIGISSSEKKLNEGNKGYALGHFHLLFGWSLVEESLIVRN